VKTTFDLNSSEVYLEFLVEISAISFGWIWLKIILYCSPYTVRVYISSVQETSTNIKIDLISEEYGNAPF